MTIRALAIACLAILAFAAPATTAQPSFDEVAPDSPGAMVDAGGLDAGYCRPYPTNPTVITYSYCFAQGTGNAAETFVNHVLDGNVTTYQEAKQKAKEFGQAVLACYEDPGNYTCPTEALAAFV